MTEVKITLPGLIRRFWKRTLLTWLLVILEGASLLLFPLVIGWSIDDWLGGDLQGIMKLASLCAVLLIVGAGRRFYDTRIYSGIYRIICNELVEREKMRQTSISKISARTRLISEFIEFLENSIPDIVNQLIGLAGTIVIIAFMDLKVFAACLAGAAVISIIYLLSQNKILGLNKGQNDEYENQVEAITSDNPTHARLHFKRLTAWNIKLSDLETVNFSLTWMVLAGVLIYSVAAASSSAATIGQVTAMVMYVFGFIESVLAFPLYYQQLIRLQDIAARLAGSPG